MWRKRRRGCAPEIATRTGQVVSTRAMAGNRLMYPFFHRMSMTRPACLSLGNKSRPASDYMGRDGVRACRRRLHHGIGSWSRDANRVAIAQFQNGGEQLRGHIHPLVVPLLLCLAALVACGTVRSPTSVPGASNPATGTPATATPTTPAAPSTQARLACTGRAVPIGAAEENGMVVHCTVTVAPANTTSFQLSATLPGGGGIGARTYPLCTGTLNAGTGTCGRTLIAPSNEWGGSLTIGGVLLPGNLALPTVIISTR